MLKINKKIGITIGIVLLIVLGIPAVLLAVPQTRKQILSGFVSSIDYKESLAIQTKPENQAVVDAGPKVDTNYSNPYVINVLFLGIDRTEERDEYLGVYRTDTISVMRIDLENKSMRVLSIPRDTYAYLPMQDRNDKINHAYAFGSKTGKEIESTEAAVNNFIQLDQVDYYFTLDMEPIPEIVDALGGVEVDVDVDMKTHGANLSKGHQVLNGKMAFDYIHWRYSGMGDIDRIKRQQNLLKAMYKKVRDNNMLFEAMEIVLKYNKNIKTSFTTEQLFGLAKIAKEIPDDQVSFYSIPGHPKNMNKISYWVRNEKETETLLNDFFKSATTESKAGESAEADPEQ